MIRIFPFFCFLILLSIAAAPAFSVAKVESKTPEPNKGPVDQAFSEWKQCVTKAVEPSCEVEELDLRAAIIESGDFLTRKNDDSKLNYFREVTAQVVVGVCSLRNISASYCAQAYSAVQKNQRERQQSSLKTRRKR